MRKAAQKNREPLLFEELRQAPKGRSPLAEELFRWRAFGKPTGYATTTAQTLHGQVVVDTFVNEYWSSAQRQGHGLHEVSYRACFKPELPAFFVERLTKPGDVVYDPFMGRGTTLLEAALRGRVPFGNDANPLSSMLLRPRLSPPRQSEVEERLESIDLSIGGEDAPRELLAFYHEDTLREIAALRAWLLARERDAALDAVDDWIRMVTVNRLTGHSPGFLSVYTMPPNQAVSVESQLRINAKRRQEPPRRDLRAVVAKKSKALLGAVSDDDRARLAAVFGSAKLSVGPAADAHTVPSASVWRTVSTSTWFSSSASLAASSSTALSA